MKINNEFSVSVPVEEAWDIMLDLERVAPCLPGASIQGSEDGEYQGTMKVKIGPITANYKGTVKVETDMKLTGRAAQFGRGIAQDVATKMLNQFADCLEKEISGRPEEGAATAATAPSTEAVEDSGDGAAPQETPPATPVGG